MTSSSRSAAAQANIAQVILRLALGLVFFAHGWQKFFDFTIPGAQKAFAGMGVPMADIAAPVVATLELAGGAALILGVLTRIVATLLTLDMIGAIVLVHASNGVFVDKGGYELVLLLGAGAAAIAAMGPGRASLDALIFGRRKNRAAALV